MPYYHVRMFWKLPEQKGLNRSIELDLSEEEARLFGDNTRKERFSSMLNGLILRVSRKLRFETPKKTTYYFPSLSYSSIFLRSTFPNVTRKFIKSLAKKEVAKEQQRIEQSLSKDMFIVHGRDDKSKLELARMLERLGFHAVILSEQPDKGRTIIEKLEQETIDIGYAFVILTPDDTVLSDWQEFWRRVMSDKESEEDFLSLIKDRARQNVILELGYFVGKIGRNHVCCLYKADVELPSDIHGVLFKKFNESVEECYKGILEELKAIGYEIKI